ncbi:YibE/F family protein [Fusibacter sp. JL298sf-3]
MHHRRIVFPTLGTLLLLAVLLILPAPFQQRLFPNTERVPVRILSTDASKVQGIGLIKQGEQLCDVEVLRGRYRGVRHEAVNLLTGSLEQDKLYSTGDKALGVVDYTEEGIQFITLVDHYRLPAELLLAVLFIAALLIFAGWVGARAILSFFCTLLIIWKIIVPAFLLGYNPIGIGLLCTALMTTVIVTLVYGIDKRALSAILGALLGTLLTALLSVVLVDAFQIHGAVMPHSESLLYAGFAHLNLTQIFTASIFIACSGAMMDVAVDITSAVDEVVENSKGIKKTQAIRSGLNVGRAIMGTMTTTLLLAYSGGFISLLMVFMAQGTPFLNILNLKHVASEILHTLVGSFGLISVAPFTALTAGLLLTPHDSDVSGAS